ncbi:MAG TPA: hypothetical protein VMT34_14995 [Aggregatilineales bacterium]|nr:hypothetical protein [Aggregatilineales bacterium]
MEIQRKYVPAAVFFIGLGFLFLMHHLFPGFLFLVAAVAIAQAWANGHNHDTLRVAAVFAGLGLLFSIGFSLPFVLVLIGIGLLFMAFGRPKHWHRFSHESWDRLKQEWQSEEELPKRKNDSMYI